MTRPAQTVATTGSGSSRPCQGLFRDREADSVRSTTARAVLFLEEVVQLAGIAFDARPALAAAAADTARPDSREQAPRDPSGAEAVLRQTDDLKVIVETVEREVIDRAMRRVEGNQSRGAHLRVDEHDHE